MEAKRQIDGSKVCVVGGAGFIGSHVVDYLIDEKQCTVTVLDDLSVGSEMYIHPKAGLRKQDITHESLDFTEFDFVFNYASKPFIPTAIAWPVETMMVNTIGALRVMEAATVAKCEALLQVTSAEVYGSMDRKPTINPHAASTYAASKVATDCLAQCRAIEADAPVVILRQFNCIGARETHPYVVPEIISQVHNAEPNDDGVYTLHLGASTFRDFMDVRDAAKVAVSLIENGTFGEAYDLGAQTYVAIYEMAAKIFYRMRPGATLEIERDETRLRPRDIATLFAHNGQINKVVAPWQPRELEESIDYAVDYFRSNGNRWDWE